MSICTVVAGVSLEVSRTEQLVRPCSGRFSSSLRWEASDVGALFLLMWRSVSGDTRVGTDDVEIVLEDSTTFW